MLGTGKGIFCVSARLRKLVCPRVFAFRILGPLPAITQIGLQVSSSTHFVTAGIAGPRKPRFRKFCQVRASGKPSGKPSALPVLTDQPGRDREGSWIEERLWMEQGQPARGRGGGDIYAPFPRVFPASSIVPLEVDRGLANRVAGHPVSKGHAPY